MNDSQRSSPRLGISCLLFDSPKFERILLCQRENEPELGLWSFPGGKLEKGEHIKDGMEREVYEETGYKVTISDDKWFNINEMKDGSYIIFTGMAFLEGAQPSLAGRTRRDIHIVKKFFSLDENAPNSVWKIKDDEAIDCLKEVIRRFMKNYRESNKDTVMAP